MNRRTWLGCLAAIGLGGCLSPNESSESSESPTDTETVSATARPSPTATATDTPTNSPTPTRTESPTETPSPREPTPSEAPTPSYDPVALDLENSYEEPVSLTLSIHSYPAETEPESPTATPVADNLVFQFDRTLDAGETVVAELACDASSCYYLVSYRVRGGASGSKEIFLGRGPNRIVTVAVYSPSNVFVGGSLS